MKQLINRPEEATNGNTRNDTGELARMAFPYLLQLFHAGLEKRHGVRISIQCTDSGTFRGALSAVTGLGEPSELGVVCFSSGESLDGILEYFEDGLTFGELDWRIDKYYKTTRETIQKSPENRVRVPLHL